MKTIDESANITKNQWKKITAGAKRIRQKYWEARIDEQAADDNSLVQ